MSLDPRRHGFKKKKEKRGAAAGTHVLRGGSWGAGSGCCPLFVGLPRIFEWVLFRGPLHGAVVPIGALFCAASFPSLRLSVGVLGRRALWAASLFGSDLLCLAILVQGVHRCWSYN